MDNNSKWEDTKRLQRALAGGHIPLIEVGAAAVEKGRNEELERVQKYLDRVGSVQGQTDGIFFDLVREETRRVGAAQVDTAQLAEMAERLEKERRVRRWVEIKSVLQELKVKDVPAEYEWAARRSGVDLFDEPPPVVLVSVGASLEEANAAVRSVVDRGTHGGTR
jgi:hypothetical protein